MAALSRKHAESWNGTLHRGACIAGRENRTTTNRPAKRRSNAHILRSRVIVMWESVDENPVSRAMTVFHFAVDAIRNSTTLALFAPGASLSSICCKKVR